MKIEDKLINNLKVLSKIIRIRKPNFDVLTKQLIYKLFFVLITDAIKSKISHNFQKKFILKRYIRYINVL